MADNNASAVTDEPHETISVLFTLHEGVDTLDFVGPLEALHKTRHNIKDPDSEAFDFTFASASPSVSKSTPVRQHTPRFPHSISPFRHFNEPPPKLTPTAVTAQDLQLKSQISFADAHTRLSDYDVLIVPGGSHEKITSPNHADTEPLPLIRAFAALQAADPSRERTLMAVSTGGLLLAKAGVLQGFAATTHHDFNVKLELMCQEASARVAEERTDVMEARYVVNNARFDLGDVDENPFVVTREDHIMSKRDRRRSSVARKGSNAWRESNRGMDNVQRRAGMRLGGLRVITSGAVTSGLDASLYLVCALVSQESAEEVARVLGYEWQKGVVVNAIDV